MSTNGFLSSVNIRSILKGKQCDKLVKQGKMLDDRHGHLICDPDAIIFDRYRFVKKLGKGYFGRVVEVIDTKTDKQLALKISRNGSKCRKAARMEMMTLRYIGLRDSNNSSLCAKLISSFKFNGHICMAFDVLGSDIYHFLKRNSYHPFPLHQIRHIAYQLCHSVCYLHQRNVIHTDLKPDNIVFVDCSSTLEYNVEKKIEIHVVNRTDIRLIDFGCAVGDELPQSGTISNRYYRAPEVILNANWNGSVDVWSTGCILYELYTGNVLLNTDEDDAEHLAIMERVIGPLPHSMSVGHKLFTNGKLNFDLTQRRAEMETHQPLQKCFKFDGEDDFYLYDLIRKLLVYEPSARITLKEALMHPFFDKLPSN